MRRHELTESQWNRIRDLLPPERKAQGGSPAKDNRMVMHGILYWLNTGVAWRDLPERFGPWQSIYTRYRRWTWQGIWENILAYFDLTGKTVICDKGYDSDKLVSYIIRRGGYAIIPSRCTSTHPRETDWHVYKERHLVENLFLKMKNRRRFATRYEKSATSFFAVSLLAAILVWLS